MALIKPKLDKKYLYDKTIEPYIKELRGLYKKGLREDQMREIDALHRQYKWKYLRNIQEQKRLLFKAKAKLDKGQTEPADEIYQEFKNLQEEERKLKEETIKMEIAIAKRNVITTTKMVSRNELCPICEKKGIKIKFKKCKEHNPRFRY